MDDIVLKGMARWPNVPAVYGWLALDRRGQWLLKDEKITNPTIVAFIGRNFAHDESGAWFFQNGPQRVYVRLEYTPHVYRLHDSGDAKVTIESSTGARPRAVRGAWVDEHGALLIETDVGIGVVHDRDLDLALHAIRSESGGTPDEDALPAMIDALDTPDAAALFFCVGDSRVPLRAIRSEDVPRRFAYVPDPRAK